VIYRARSGADNFGHCRRHFYASKVCLVMVGVDTMTEANKGHRQKTCLPEDFRGKAGRRERTMGQVLGRYSGTNR